MCCNLFRHQFFLLLKYDSHNYVVSLNQMLLLITKNMTATIHIFTLCCHIHIFKTNTKVGFSDNVHTLLIY